MRQLDEILEYGEHLYDDITNIEHFIHNTNQEYEVDETLFKCLNISQTAKAMTDCLRINRHPRNKRGIMSFI